MVATGCTAGGLPMGADADVHPDCDALRAEVAAWLDAHVACARDDDCLLLYTACGLAGSCGAYANHTASGARLDGLVATWSAGGCASECGCPAVVPPMPACNGGVCGPRAAAELGDACRTDSDCAPGRCLVAEGFPGGYCTVDCTAAPCLPDGACRPIAGGRWCLLPCDPGRPGACRDGYACCSGGPGPFATPPVCAPPASIYCLGV